MAMKRDDRSPASGGEYYAESTTPSSGPEASPESPLIDAIVRQTDLARGEAQQLSREEVDRLSQVAQRLERQHVDRQQQAVQLTHTLLEMRRPSGIRQNVSLDHLAQAIADDLLDSPVSSARFDRLWKYLLGATS